MDDDGEGKSDIYIGVDVFLGRMLCLSKQLIPLQARAQRQVFHAL